MAHGSGEKPATEEDIGSSMAAKNDIAHQSLLWGTKPGDFPGALQLQVTLQEYRKDRGKSRRSYARGRSKNIANVSFFRRSRRENFIDAIELGERVEAQNGARCILIMITTDTAKDARTELLVQFRESRLVDGISMNESTKY